MDTLKVGIIGAGRIGKVHTETIARNVADARILEIVDANLAEAKKLAEKFNIDKCSADYKNIIDNADIDAVIICSPTNTHAQYTMEAARAGKHVFCEKPVDLDIKTIQKVIETVSKYGVKLMVGFNRRFDANFMKIKQMVMDGKIGDPHILKITSRDPSPPPTEYIKISGGMFLDMTIHDFDMARFITGSEVRQVYVSAKVLVDPQIGKQGDVDTAVINLEFENGALGVIDNSRKAVYGYDQRVEIFGSRGMVKVDNNSPDNHDYYNDSGVHASLPLNFFMDRYTEAYAREMQQFCSAISKNEAVPVDGNDGLKSVVIGLAAKKSVIEQRPVKISEIL